METTATSKGQIVIPSSVRRKLGIKEGTRIQVEIDEEAKEIILKPIMRKLIVRYVDKADLRDRKRIDFGIKDMARLQQHEHFEHYLGELDELGKSMGFMESSVRPR